jgi:glycosyltransferase involved in cell wall biosynthesis
LNNPLPDLGFDAKRLFFNKTGLGNYSRSIVHCIANTFPGIRIGLFSPSEPENWNSSLINSTGDNKKIYANTSIILPEFKTPWWRSSGIGKYVKKNGFHVFHGLSNEIPLDLPKSVKKICTIHDVIFKEHPYNYPWIDRKIYDIKVSYAIKKSNHIIATSERTKKQICRFYQCSEDTIKVVYQPVHPLFYHSVETADTKLKNVDRPYFIYHSSFTKRKNHKRLIEAFKCIEKELEVNLVLAGSEGETLNEVKNLIIAAELSNRIILKTNLTTQELVAWCKNAIGFVYPSISEGFGIPLIEAMSLNTPVIASNTSCLPEVVEEAGILIDPYNIDDIVESIQKLINDKRSAQRYKEKGLERAQLFTWDNMAKKTYQVYKKLLIDQ